MRLIQLFILIGILSLSLSSCSDDDELMTEVNIDCTTDFENHPNANSFQSLVDNYAADGFVGMTVLVDHPNDGLWMGSSGLASIEDNIDMNPCHLHYAASLYKSFIATIIMQLVEEGELGLEDRLSEYLPNEITDRLPNGDVIRIKNLLQQRSGLADIFEVEFITDFFNNPTKQYTILELLEYVYDKEAQSEVGTEFYYSDANFSLLTLVIEEVEGNFVQQLKNRIFIPLELNDTYFLEDQSQLPVGLADSYWERFSDGNVENNTEVQIALATGLRGSDGIVTSADDLKTFLKALANGELVSSISQMTDFVDVSEQIREREVYSGYGMGLMKVQISGEVWYGHFGNHIGSGAIMLYNGDRDITLIALQNTGTFFSDTIKGKFFYRLLDDIESILF